MTEPARQETELRETLLPEVPKMHWSGTAARQVRERVNLPRPLVALAIGVHDASVARWEASVSEPKTSSACALAQLYGCRPEAFLVAEETTK